MTHDAVLLSSTNKSDAKESQQFEQPRNTELMRHVEFCLPMYTHGVNLKAYTLDLDIQEHVHFFYKLSRIFFNLT